MALLIEERTARTHTLAAHVLVGRSSTCTLRLDDPRVSSEHARLSWQGSHWQVRDLASRNGTFVNDEKLARGATLVLYVGDRIAFGQRAAPFVLDDASPPSALARRPGTDQTRLARDGMLVLPSEDVPTACVFQDPDGAWIVEMDGAGRTVQDGEVLEVEGEAWTLHLPTPEVGTADARNSTATARGNPGLRFRVTRDEEHVEVIVDSAGTTHVLPPRAHYYTLLTLARVRVHGHRDDVPESARGWITVDELCRMLATDEMKLNVDVFRVRRDLAKLGLANATNVIERRRSSRQLRLAWTPVHVESLS